MYSLFTPAVGTPEIDAVEDVMSAGTLSTGSVVKDFEQEVAEFVGRSHGVAVCSGSVALELALQASDLEPGQSVAVSPYNCSAVLHSIRRAGLDVRFVDIDPETFNIDSARLRDELQDSTEDIHGTVVTHLYGHPANLSEIRRVADEHDLTVVDDFCQAPGATDGERPVGSLGVAGVCSFGATKNLTTGEGGIVVTDRKDLAQEVKEYRSNNGADTPNPALSVRMSDIEAAIGLEQLSRYGTVLKQKRRLADEYRQRLRDPITPQTHRSGATHVYHRFAVRVPKRESLIDWLATEGIEAAPAIDKPLYEYQCAPTDSAQCPETELTIDKGLLLPLHVDLDPTDVATIAEKVNEFFDSS